MKFLALDVETANADYSSICQIGIVEFRGSQIVDKWSTLINPEAYFDPFNVSIHGITENDVKDAPAFDSIYTELIEKITDQITVHHMPFDKIAISRACIEYKLEILQPKWLDSAKIVRRTWEEFAYKGYGLANIAEFLNIEFAHHDALEDAIAAAKIVHHACEKTGLSIEEWLQRVEQPIFTHMGGSSSIKIEGNPEGSLYGENLVFTGALFLPRKDAAKIAADLGCNVGNSVSKKTTLLVVGTQDLTKLAGYEKSSKHRKAEELAQKGVHMRILSEKDFVEMCNSENGYQKLEVPKPTDISKEIKKKEPIEKTEMTIELDEAEVSKIAEEINNVWDKLTDEQKEALHKADHEYQKLVDSIKECSHEEKRTLTEVFKSYLEKIEHYHDQYEIESFEDDDIDVIDSIDIEISQLQDILYDLMKDKVSLAEFFESLTDSIDLISSDLEEGAIPKPIKDYAVLTLTELKKIEKKILTFANKTIKT